MLVSAGGGAVGERLLRAALAARPLTRYAAAPWLLVGGHNLPAAAFDLLAAALARRLRAGALPRRTCAALMGRCEVSVSQAGYNTVVEGLAAGARMVLVPFAAGERGRAGAARRTAGRRWAWPSGWARLTVDGRSLAAAIDRIGARPRPDPALGRFDGAARSAAIVAGMVRERFGDA